ncbi:hypothetical protein BA1DRAFT_00443 [Photorhabdus aegyptia]|uniref:Uncharacterized protein n=1 Tax=Photorhabdus aegyptia TaxID=2805098 RepID=A0A022PNF1_9GAMM|nr:hypothetical protein BA1DRAFT_00443 [Photorhabdus aegyptia]
MVETPQSRKRLWGLFCLSYVPICIERGASADLAKKLVFNLIKTMLKQLKGIFIMNILVAVLK